MTRFDEWSGCGKIRFLKLPRKSGKTPPVEGDLGGIIAHIGFEILIDLLRDCRDFEGFLVAGDVLLVAEHTLVRTA